MVALKGGDFCQFVWHFSSRENSRLRITYTFTGIPSRTVHFTHVRGTLGNQHHEGRIGRVLSGRALRRVISSIGSKYREIVR